MLVYDCIDGENVLEVDVLPEQMIDVSEYQPVEVLGEVARVEEELLMCQSQLSSESPKS